MRKVEWEAKEESIKQRRKSITKEETPYTERWWRRHMLATSAATGRLSLGTPCTTMESANDPVTPAFPIFHLYSSFQYIERREGFLIRGRQVRKTIGLLIRCVHSSLIDVWFYRSCGDTKRRSSVVTEVVFDDTLFIFVRLVVLVESHG